MKTKPQTGSKSTGAAGNAGPTPNYGVNALRLRLPHGASPSYGSGSNAGSSSGSTSSSAAAKVKHNRIYTAADIIQKFGNPSSRSSTMTAEHWVYKCKDGVVHVHFTQVGYIGGSSASTSEKLRLEVKSVDSTSSPATGNSRF